MAVRENKDVRAYNIKILETISLHAPKGSQRYVNGVYYKEGMHRYMYEWNTIENDWVKTTLNKKQIIKLNKHNVDYATVFDIDGGFN